MTERRAPQRVAVRREQILETARRLFDAEGTAAVSTARIAREADISPGNLYYWFPDKADIIRALYERWSAASEPPVDVTWDAADILRVLWQSGGRQASITGSFTFLARELFTLLRFDPVLEHLYRENMGRRIDLLEELAATVIRAGLARHPQPPVTLRDVIAHLWLIAETAVPFADVVGSDHFDPRRTYIVVIEPLLTDRGRAVVGLPPRGLTS
ncbi:TetR/AcrR family transcriptional regulator [Gordonia sp. NPDC003424]